MLLQGATRFPGKAAPVSLQRPADPSTASPPTTAVKLEPPQTTSQSTQVDPPDDQSALIRSLTRENEQLRLDYDKARRQTRREVDSLRMITAAVEENWDEVVDWLDSGEVDIMFRDRYPWIFILLNHKP